MSNYSLQHPIRAWRTAREPSLTAQQVANAAGIDVTSLSKVENGHRDRLGADACVALVKAFPGELKLEDLLSWSWREQKKQLRAKKAS